MPTTPTGQAYSSVEGSSTRQPSATGKSGAPSATQSGMPIPIPFVGNPLQRGVSTGDQRYVNTIFEQMVNPVTGGKSTYLRKRPGTSKVSQPKTSAGVGRGIFTWSKTGEIYTVIDDKMYHGTTAFANTLATTTGRVWFTTSPSTSTTQYLIINDGTDMYLIESNHTVTLVDENSDAQFPNGNLGPVFFFDDYIFLAKSTGEIFNSDVDAPTAWTSAGVISATAYGDPLECIARQKDQIVAFGKSSIQMFYDNATTGSPLARVEQNAFQVGMSSRATFAQGGEIICWVGEASEAGDANRQVWMMEGLTKIKPISDPVINRFLAEEGSNISNASAWMERVDGHLLYVLNLVTTASRTLVYNIDLDIWSEWQVANGTTELPFMSASSLNGETHVLDIADGNVYKFADTIYQDNLVNFTVTCQTDRLDFGMPLRKFMAGLWIDGDTTASAANLAVTVSDDDYTTFTTARNVDMTTARKFLPVWGAFFSRCFKFTFTANLPLRLRNFYVSIEQGQL